MKVAYKINTDAFKNYGHSKGDVVSFEAYENGKLKELFWRRRVKDAEYDNCMEIAGTAKKGKPNDS